MSRNDNFTLRMNATERQLIAAVAKHLDRTESDTVRHLLRKEARELGIVPVAPKEDRHVAHAT